jgi:hypothetical protein
MANNAKTNLFIQNPDQSYCPKRAFESAFARVDLRRRERIGRRIRTRRETINGFRSGRWRVREDVRTQEKRLNPDWILGGNVRKRGDIGLRANE